MIGDIWTGSGWRRGGSERKLGTERAAEGAAGSKAQDRGLGRPELQSGKRTWPGTQRSRGA